MYSRRADRHAGLGQLARRRLGDRPGDAEVGDQRVAVREQDVLGLDVAVDDALLVGVPERVGDLAGDPDGVVDRQLRLPVEPVAQRLALDERHDVVEEAVGLARVVQRQDVRVLSLAAISISRRNRSAPMAAASSGWSTLIATSRSCLRSWAR